MRTGRPALRAPRSVRLTSVASAREGRARLAWPVPSRTWIARRVECVERNLPGRTGRALSVRTGHHRTRTTRPACRASLASLAQADHVPSVLPGLSRQPAALRARLARVASRGRAGSAINVLQASSPTASRLRATHAVLASRARAGSVRSARTGLSRMRCLPRARHVLRARPARQASAACAHQAPSRQLAEMSVLTAGQAMLELMAPAACAHQAGAPARILSAVTPARLARQAAAGRACSVWTVSKRTMCWSRPCAWGARLALLALVERVPTAQPGSSRTTPALSVRGAALAGSVPMV